MQHVWCFYLLIVTNVRQIEKYTGGSERMFNTVVDTVGMEIFSTGRDGTR